MRFFILIISVLSLSCHILNALPVNQTGKLNPKSDFFIENKGQWPDEVRYLARTGGMNAWITDEGVVYDYFKITRHKKEKNDRPMFDKFQQDSSTIIGHVVKMSFEQRGETSKVSGSDKKKTYYNYFIGNDESNWASFVPLYGEVTVEDVCDGVDIRYYYDAAEEKKFLRYDYIVEPGADLSQIRMRFEGQDGINVTETGELSINTCLGEVKHCKIYAYQESTPANPSQSPIRKSVPVRFTQNPDGTVGLAVENYRENKELIIDPLIYSTFIGGNGVEYGYGIAIDGSGSAFVTGYTRSTNYPTSSGAYNEEYNGSGDVFVSKLSTDGSSLIYSTFIGGNGVEYGYGIAIDGSGSAFVTGYTESTNYPTSSGAYDEDHNGSADVFVSKLSSDGSSMIFSTFIGGNRGDYGNSIAVDASGVAYVTGYTRSTNYPTSSGAYDETHNDTTDVFISKLSTDGSSLIYSTFIGGNGIDYGNGIAIDGSGSAFVTGYTGSTNYPTSSGAFDEDYNGYYDVFVSKLSTDGSSLIYSTFIGGSGAEYSNGIAIDGSGSAFVTASTGSANYPTSSGAFDEDYNGSADAFVSKLSTDGSSLIYSTFIGGNYSEACNGIAIDGSGAAFVTGHTGSTNYPTSSGAYDEDHNGIADVFVTKLGIGSINIASGIESSYCPGTATNLIFDVSRTYNSDNIFTAELSDRNGDFSNPDTLGSVVSTESDTIEAEIPAVPAGSGYRIRIVSSDPPEIGSDNGEDITIHPVPYIEIFEIDYSVPGSEAVCAWELAEYSTNEGYENKWEIEGGEIIGSDDKRVVEVQWYDGVDGAIILTQTNEFGCASIRKQKIPIMPLPETEITSGKTILCEGSEELYLSSEDENVEYYWEVSNGSIIEGETDPECLVQWDVGVSSGTISLTQTSKTYSCENTVVKEIEFVPYPEPEIVSGDFEVCEGSESLYVSSEDESVEYYWEVSNGSIIEGETDPECLVQWDVGVSSGTIALTQTSKTYGCENRTTKLVALKPAPEVEFILSTIEVCLDASAFELSGGYPEGGTYSGVGVDDGFFDPAEAGVGEHEINYTYKENGCENSDTAKILVLPKPEKPEINEGGGRLSSSNAVSYQWLYEDEEIAGATKQYFQPDKEGFYKVEITDENGCKNVSEPYYFSFSSVYEQSKNKFNAYVAPNPVSAEAELRFTLEKPTLCRARIINLQGKETIIVFEKKYLDAGEHRYPLDTGNLPAGVRFLDLRCGNYETRIPFVKVE